MTKAGSWGNFFYEANTWEYSLYVPHDVKSLIDFCGGRDSFISRLDIFFTNGHFQVSNEPSFFTPCLYAYAGRQDKTNSTIRSIIKNNYSAAQDGIPGNDDAGSMSVWVIFNLMGFFPNAGQDIYIITSPHFERVSINMGKNKVLKIITHNHSNKNIYIEKATINGNALDRSWFIHNDIKDGATIEFFMGDLPSDFGKENLPPSLNDYN